MKNDGLSFCSVYIARCKSTERYHLANIHQGNLETFIQIATPTIPFIAGRSIRMLFYSSETIPAKTSRKKISGEGILV
jgi:hypothetical protein